MKSSDAIESPQAELVGGLLNKFWRPPVLAFLMLVALSVLHLWLYTWNQENYAHGPVVALILFWVLLSSPVARATKPPAILTQASGWMLLIAGCLSFAVGWSQTLPVIEVPALIVVAVAMLLISGGVQSLLHYKFALLFSIFLLPVPNFIIDFVTSPLKVIISSIAETALFTLGYPISRSGVILTIGPYQLLVADACSGINSIFALSAMGLIYMKFVSLSRGWKAFVVVLLFIPIAMISNVLRVMVLVLITYHFGDAAGQGFLHGAAGVVLFGLAFFLMLGLDMLLAQANRPMTSSQRAGFSS